MTDVKDIAVFENAIYRFGSQFDRSTGTMSGFYASKTFTGEDAAERVKWRTIVFHGHGTIQVSCYIDNVLTLSDTVTMSDIPTQHRVMNLPRGKSTGYNMRYEYTIDSGYVRFAEIYYEPMWSDVN